MPTPTDAPYKIRQRNIGRTFNTLWPASLGTLCLTVRDRTQKPERDAYNSFVKELIHRRSPFHIIVWNKFNR